jgi:hypothetical protein
MCNPTCAKSERHVSLMAVEASPLPLSSEQLTCRRQVQGENNTSCPTFKKILGWPIQAFFWLEWGCSGLFPPLL